MRKRTHTHSDFIADILSVPQASKDTCFSMKQIYSKNLNLSKQDWYQFSCNAGNFSKPDNVPRFINS